MSRYRRMFIDGGTFFFTVTLADRRSDLLTCRIDLLREAYSSVQRRLPFQTDAICVLPDHIHAIWTLPNGEADYPARWRRIKAMFSRALPTEASRTGSKLAKREKGIWQRRYWEHAIRDEHDLSQHLDYVYYNPVKHGLVSAVKHWPYSSFHRDVSRGLLPLDWGGDLRAENSKFGERREPVSDDPDGST